MRAQLDASIIKRARWTSELARLVLQLLANQNFLRQCFPGYSDFVDGLARLQRLHVEFERFPERKALLNIEYAECKESIRQHEGSDVGLLAIVDYYLRQLDETSVQLGKEVDVLTRSTTLFAEKLSSLKDIIQTLNTLIKANNWPELPAMLVKIMTVLPQHLGKPPEFTVVLPHAVFWSLELWRAQQSMRDSVSPDLAPTSAEFQAILSHAQPLISVLVVELCTLGMEEFAVQFDELCARMQRTVQMLTQDSVPGNRTEELELLSSSSSSSMVP